MMTLVSYDVSTVDAAGRKRLRKVAKECVITDKECKILCLKLMLITEHS